jgi:hypothetical protein
MSNTLESRNKKKLFKDICQLISPNYFSTASPDVVQTTSRNLEYTCNPEELLEQAKEFNKKYPQGILNIEFDLGPMRGQGLKYREKISKILEGETTIKIMPDPTVPSSFYLSILNYCFRKQK